eukprot:TRINITY_DN58525_c0_g1_i1.p1 TRINITY_DN58525_c0_g1~~TRINITY_DN58525_c0_g1_i1.p1  ORF type:complete len:576 (-),score=74.48 TRINITY_DN58525_c0_g1_i1:172-1818(-)
MVDGVTAEGTWGFTRFRPQHVSQFFIELRSAFSLKLLCILGIIQWVLKGFAFSALQAGVPWILRAYKVDGPRMQIYSSIIMLPWAIKPLFGLVSDFFPLCGYGKMPYMVLTSVIGSFSYGVVGLTPMSKLDLHLVVICLTLGLVQTSLCDLLTEAVYSTRIRSNPEKGTDLVTFVWMGVFAGSFLATVSAGPILEYFGPQTLIGVCTVPSALVLLPTCLNFHGEVRKEPEEVQAHRERYMAQPELIFLCVFIAGSTLVLATISMMDMPISHTVSTALVLLVCIVLVFVMLTKPVLGLMNAFFMLQSAFALTIEGGAFYFFTDDHVAFPAGPHFSKIFYTTGIGVVSTVFSMIGMLLYQAFCKSWRYHTIFYAGNLLTCGIHTLSVLVFTRYNLVLGIPDEVFMVGTVMINSMLTQVLWVPTMLMISHICPKDMEATVFALVAGCGNLGRGIADFLGAGLLSSLGVSPDGSANESAQFDKLWVAALIAALAPVTTICLIPLMVPDARQDEKLLEDSSSAVDGSPWKRFRAKSSPCDTEKGSPQETTSLQ